MKKWFLLYLSATATLHLYAQNIGIGTTSPITKLHVEGIAQNIATFNGGQGMWITLAEAGTNRGYIGSYTGNPEDVDFGTYGSNGSGKVHLSTSNTPRLTVASNGNIGIGVVSPLTILDVAGSIRIGNSTLNLEGNIRYNNGKFEGYNGTGWTRFDQLPTGNIAYSYHYPDAALESAGFKLVTSFKNQARLFDTTGVISNTWLPTATLVADDPVRRSSYCAAWTGNKMIIWGGSDADNNEALLNSGCAYDPSRNTWKDISSVNAPSPRLSPNAIWSGTEMIIWSGYVISPVTYLNNGGRYNPSTDTWSSLNTVNAPSPRKFHTAIWTGTEMIIWGGVNVGSGIHFNDGAKYNPATNTWTPISLINAPDPRRSHSAVWTGTEMIIWGGINGAGFFNNGAKYNPATDTWTAISISGTPTARYAHSAVWTGTEMIIWGGIDENGHLGTGAKYNLTANTWQSINNSGAPTPLSNHHSAWTGSKMIIWGSVFPSPSGGSGGLYDPASNSWSPMSSFAQQSTLSGLGSVSVWTGTEFIVQGGFIYEPTSTPGTRAGGRYFPNALPGLQTTIERKGYLYLYMKN